MNILLVDDDFSCVKALADFPCYGHTLHITSNSIDALDAFKVNHYDVVITDIGMHKMNGIELLKAMKKRDKRTYVIILTDDPSKEYELNAERCGAHNFFTKPIDVISFKDTLNRIEHKINNLKNVLVE